MAMEALDMIKNVVSDKTIVISLAPKITIEKISSKLETKNIARMIPNATSYINKAYNPICFASAFATRKRQSTFRLLKVMGKTFQTEESSLEAYAIISDMLPSYFWFQWKELERIGIHIGLSETESKEAVRETITAAVELLYSSDLCSEEVIDLIPLKPIAEHEGTIKNCFSDKLIPLYGRIKP